jgi:predicted thioesterase
MSASLEVGLEGTHEFKAEGLLLTDVDGSLPKAVLSTPGMIGVMENTATRLVAPYLDEGAATVGFEVCIKHVAAVLEGGSCVARARLDEIVDGRKLRFSVEVVSADGRTVGVGTHERRIIGGRRS